MSSTVIENRPPWVYKRFVKEKLFVRERYWRQFRSLDQLLLSSQNTSTSTTSPSSKPCIVIPHGTIWRKYLKLWMAVAEKRSSSAALQLVLLESAVELMDWRNATPCIEVTEDDDDGSSAGKLKKEATAVQEKSRLRKLVESEQVTPFCDMSVREDECDEFDVLDYPSMSIQDRSRYAMFRAGRMLGGDNVTLVVDLTDYETLKDEELNVQTIDDFLEQLMESNFVSSDMAEELEATKVRCEEDYRRRNAVRDEVGESVAGYLSEADVQKGLRDGSLARGRLDVTRENAKEGYVTTSQGRFFINQDEEHFNHAIHQDIVVIRPMPEIQWGRPVGRRRLIYNADSEESEVSANAGPAVPSAIVVAIVELSRRKYVATLVDAPSSDERAVIVVPMDMRIPRIRIQTKGWQRFQNQRLLVEIDSWEITSNYPNGHCVEILGPFGEMETEIACLLLEHEIRFTPFSASATASLPPEGPAWKLPPSELASRKDLRKTCRIFSVDPSGCQDIDDTMHVRTLPNGDVEVGVHIADVVRF